MGGAQYEYSWRKGTKHVVSSFLQVLVKCIRISLYKCIEEGISTHITDTSYKEFWTCFFWSKKNFQFWHLLWSLGGIFSVLYFSSILGKFSGFFVVCWLFPKSTFLKNSFRNTISVSNSLDPDQTWYIVGPDLDSNCLQRLSADDISRQRVMH